MKNLIISTCTTLFLLLFITIKCSACQLGLAPVKKFNAYEYVFIGKVIGYTNAYESKEIRDKVFGLVVELKQKVYLPKTPTKYFEVLPYVLLSDCSERGKNQSELSKNFPVGSVIRVIAVESKRFPNLPNQDNFRLDISEGSSSVSVNDDKLKEFLTSSDSNFDYKKIKFYDYNYSDIANFELRKDLQRLEFSFSDVENQEILNRLIFYPFPNDIDFNLIAQIYMRNFSKASEIINKRNKFIEEKEKILK